MMKKVFYRVLFLVFCLISLNASSMHKWSGTFESSTYVIRSPLGAGYNFVHGGLSIKIDPEDQTDVFLHLKYEGLYKRGKGYGINFNFLDLTEDTKAEDIRFEFAHPKISSGINFQATEYEHKKRIIGTYESEYPMDSGKFELYYENEYPDIIYVSGMPFMLRGWNGAYLLKMTQDGPEWHLVSHSYYGIEIIPTKIFKRNNIWLFKDKEEWRDGFVGPEGDSPLGEWGEFLVTDHKNFSTWWRSNISKYGPSYW